MPCLYECLISDRFWCVICFIVTDWSKEPTKSIKTTIDNMLLCRSEQRNFWLYSCHSASYICGILEAYSSSVAVQWNEQNHHHCLSVGEFLSLSHNITGCLNPLLSRFFLTGCPIFLESKKHESSNPWTISSSNQVHKKNTCYNFLIWSSHLSNPFITVLGFPVSWKTNKLMKDRTWQILAQVHHTETGSSFHYPDYA
jgi:hypothetical protein